ncbi:hypothetical protein [Neorhizobium galegae]|uniref:Uncharacterized protein n=1 Tax=Neorhizobium galegae bv. officinalis TaxID=323656 RepID=A0A0T7GVA7_NEOGA|nr:hypothetical protein [Neorhizobium galegae]CDZ51183.1 Hypothetical protein NGAL_HAMBI1189_38400 [Neorhizobium galegae bv. officinalis]
MSSDTHPDVPQRIHCETISPTSSHLACHRSHGAILRYPGSDLGGPLADDPAALIGLALGHVREGDCLTGTVPDAITGRLRAHADHGNPACRLLLDWLAGRNRDLVASSQPDPAKPHSTKPRPGRRMIRERRQAGPGSLKRRKPAKTQSPHPKTAIIAAATENRIDE